MIIPPSGAASIGSADAAAQVARLAREAVYVRLDGLHAIKHAIRFGAHLEIVVTGDRDSTLALARTVAPDIVDRLSTELVTITADDLRGLVQRDPVGAVVGVACRPAWPKRSPADDQGPVILLEEPRHLGNVGAVIRVAAGFGARGVRVTGSVDPWHPAVVRGAAGLHFAVPVESTSLEDAVRDGDGPVVVLDPVGVDLRSFDIPSRAVLAFGGERAGVSARLRDRADQVVAIPIRDLVSSYNLATAVAMTLYHWSLGTGLRGASANGVRAAEPIEHAPDVGRSIAADPDDDKEGR